MEDDHPGAEGGDVVRLVGGEQDGTVAAELGDDLPEPDPLLGVQTDRGLIEDEHPGSAEHGGREREPLAHPAGEGVDPVLAPVREADGGQDTVDFGAAGGFVGDLLEDRDVVEERGHGEAGVEAGRLGQVAEAPPDRPMLTGIGCLDAVDHHPPLGWPLGGRECTEQARLAGPVGAQQSGHADPDGERDVVEDDAVSVGDPE